MFVAGLLNLPPAQQLRFAVCLMAVGLVGCLCMYVVVAVLDGEGFASPTALWWVWLAALAVAGIWYIRRQQPMFRDAPPKGAAAPRRNKY